MRPTVLALPTAVGDAAIPASFFNLDAPLPLVWQSLAVGAVGAGLVEVIYRLSPSVRPSIGMRS